MKKCNFLNCLRESNFWKNNIRNVFRNSKLALLRNSKGPWNMKRKGSL